MYQCPRCKNHVDSSMNICPYCGFDLRSYFSQGFQSNTTQIPPGTFQAPPTQIPPNPPPSQSYPPPSQFSPSSPYHQDSFQDTSQAKQGNDIPFFLGIAGTSLGVINLCSWLLPCVGCPLSLIGLGISIYGLTSNNKIAGIIGVVLNSITLLLSLVNSIIGMITALSN